MVLDFMSMMETLDSRKLARYEIPNQLIVDTRLVTDSDGPYETAVSHWEYKNGDWIVVETHSSKKKACRGHGQWVKKMTIDVLPASLVDISTAPIVNLARDVGIPQTHERQASN